VSQKFGGIYSLLNGRDYTRLYEIGQEYALPLIYEDAEIEELGPKQLLALIDRWRNTLQIEIPYQTQYMIQDNTAVFTKGEITDWVRQLRGLSAELDNIRSRLVRNTRRFS